MSQRLRIEFLRSEWNHLRIVDIARGDDYGGALREAGRQKPEKKIVREVIDCECGFESITCPMLGVSELRTGIHDEDVDLRAVQLLRERLNVRPNIRKTRQIQWQGLDRRILVVSCPQDQFRVWSGKDPLCGNCSETGSSACHNDCFHWINPLCGTEWLAAASDDGGSDDVAILYINV